MGRFSQITREEVLEAARTFNAIDPADLKATFGASHKPTRFMVTVNRRQFPSKALLAVASGMHTSTFSGGYACTAPVFHRLGFTVTKNGAPCAPRKVLEASRRAAKKVTKRNRVGLPEGCYWYASGTNRAGEIAGLAAAGSHIGVAAPECSLATEEALEALADTETKVFIDSGAFSEVKFHKDGPPTYPKPITPARWRRVLDLYVRMARVLGENLTVVAPDRVGDQAETYVRMSQYAETLAEITSHGARVLVPCQKGPLSQAQAWVACRDLLVDAGCDSLLLTPALPCNKAATTPDEAAEFSIELADDLGLEVHLLGLGPRARQPYRFAEYVTAMAGRRFSCDSAWIPSVSGRTNGPKNGPRAMTQAKDAARLVLGALAPAFVLAQVSTMAAAAMAL